MQDNKDHIDIFLEKVNEEALKDHMEYIDGDAENGPVINAAPFEPMTREDLNLHTIPGFHLSHVGQEIRISFTDDGDGFVSYVLGFYDRDPPEERCIAVVQTSHEGTHTIWSSLDDEHEAMKARDTEE
jgi:hypothetical protein